MTLLYKSDWDEAKERYRAWWAGEALDRCAIWVTAPRDGVDAGDPPTAPDDPVERWTDLDFLAELNDFQHRRTFFGGEAFPIWSPGYPGHTSMAVLMGCPITLDRHTGWVEPILGGATWTLEDIRCDYGSRWGLFAVKLAQQAAKESQGKSIPSVGAFGATGDTLAHLRGNEPLLLDVLDNAELVRRTELYLADLWIEHYARIYDIVAPASDGGSTCWFPLWAPGTFYSVQNDFSCMISTRMLDELFFPALERQTEYLDYALYHVDGVDAFRHVPRLCDLPGIQAFQILPGAGKPSPLHYMDVLKTVQAHGKNLHIAVPPDEVETALAELSARGLFIFTWTETESDARKLLADAEKWSHD